MEKLPHKMVQLMYQAWMMFEENIVVVLALIVCLVITVMIAVRIIRHLVTNRHVHTEHEQLLQDVAHLTLEKQELEEDTIHLMEENYQLTQRVATLRERNLSDTNEENNQLFHDVALLTLENKEIQEKNTSLHDENKNLLQTIAQLRERRSREEKPHGMKQNPQKWEDMSRRDSARKPPETNAEVAELWQHYATLLEENEEMKRKYDALKVQRDRAMQYYKHRDKSQSQSRCPLS